MSKENPAEMSNFDLERDMELRKQSSQNKSTAAEGELLQPTRDVNSKDNIDAILQDNGERDLDDLSHNNIKETTGKEEDLDDLVHKGNNENPQVHNGNLPDPEAIPGDWEERDTGDKTSS